ncbi:MAG: glycerophosphodiester phosphodiesterase, partial [Alphaproteobacteria bacterium]|nr:glycerophosphodiester phosphodiesterase [Alphaproteobacteria bacterium]
NGRGSIAETALADVRALDAGRWFSERFAGERVPTLEETFALLESLNVGANIEIKPTAGREAETGRVAAELVAASWPDTLPPPIFSSFKPEAVSAAQAAAPAIPRGLLLRRLRAGWQDEARRLDCLSIHCNQRYLNGEDAAQVLDAGYRLLAYTVNTAKRARQLFEIGVESVFSDYPDRILAM